MIGTIALALIPLIVVAPPKERFTKRVVLVVDCSGSMSGLPFSKALEAVRMVGGQATDEMELSTVAFTSTAQWWEPTSGRTWTKLPNAKHLKGLVGFLKAKSAWGGTNIIPALEEALSSKKDKLTVVIVSDGDWRETPEDVIRAVDQLQAGRRRRHLRPALVCTIRIGKPDKKPRPRCITRLGIEGRGGAFLLQVRKKRVVFSPR